MSRTRSRTSPSMPPPITWTARPGLPILLRTHDLRPCLTTCHRPQCVQSPQTGPVDTGMPSAAGAVVGSRSLSSGHNPCRHLPHRCAGLRVTVGGRHPPFLLGRSHSPECPRYNPCCRVQPGSEHGPVTAGPDPAPAIAGFRLASALSYAERSNLPPDIFGTGRTLRAGPSSFAAAALAAAPWLRQTEGSGSEDASAAPWQDMST